jgi:Zn-finger nucleic acid-binding protein
MQCRICQSEMECQPRMDITYHECRNCGGLWLSGGALEAL